MAFPHSWLVTGFVTRWPRRVSLVGQELLTLPGHLSSPPVYRGVRVTRSFVLYVCFVDRCLSFCTFSFGHCVVWSSSIYGFWLPIWYLQILQTLQWPKEKRTNNDLQHITQKTKDTKRVIRIHISKKNRQHNGQKKKYKRTNNDLQNIHI